MYKARPASTRVKGRQTGKIHPFILVLVCYWWHLHSVVAIKLLAGPSVNFIYLFYFINITEFTILFSLDLFPSSLLCSFSSVVMCHF